MDGRNTDELRTDQSSKEVVTELDQHFCILATSFP
jgi:hypothetical protein